MRQKKEISDFERHIAILGHRDFYGLFAGRPELVNDIAWRVPESSPYKRWEWVKREELLERVEEYQQLGWTVWISLNDMEPGHMIVDSVRRISVIWFDVDAPRSDKTRPADEEEKLIAKLETEKLNNFLQRKYKAKCFLACSGNGWHLYCPIQTIELPTAKHSWDFNARLREWMKRVKEESGVEFDHTYNINRLVQPIGFPNLKIPHHPLPTYWYDKFDMGDIENAREQNATLLESILNVTGESTNKINKSISQPTRKHPTIEELMHRDKWCRDIYEGRWAQDGYPSRSEAELACVRELVYQGFTDAEINEVMMRCGIGKWQAAGESYRRNTIRKARLWESRKRR